MRKQDVLAFVEARPVEEPPLHIESPYRPDPAAAGAGAGSGGRTAASCRGYAVRSAST